nr:MAG TPA: Major capsid protein [Caudoviricetes sp.]
MAQIILSESSNMANSLYGEIQAPIASFLERKDEAWMHDESNIATKIFKRVNSTHHSEAFTGLGTVDTFAPVGENGAYPQGGLDQGYVQTLAAETWKGSFAISEEMMEDKMDSVLVGKPQGFLDDYHRKRSAFFAGLLGSAIKNLAAYTVDKRKFSTLCADGSKLFAAAHAPKTKGGNQCNAFTDAFSSTALGKLATNMQNLCDDDGNMLTLNPDTIIIPNIAGIKEEVFGVLGAHNDSNTAAGNKFNYLFGGWNVLIWNELNKYCTGDSNTPWILMDSQYNKRYDGAIDLMRKDLTVKSEIAHNDANVWKGRARFTGGFVDFRCFAAGGLSFGNTL